MLWDPSQDLDELERSYYDGFYGGFADAAQECVADAYAVLNAERDDADSVQRLREIRGELAARIGDRELPPTIARRLGRIRLAMDYFVAREDYFRCVQEGDEAASAGAAERLVQFVEANRLALEDYYANNERRASGEPAGADMLIPTGLRSRS